MKVRPQRGTYRRLLAYVRPYRGTLVVATGASIVSAAAAAAYAYLIGPLLGALLGGKAAELGGLSLGDRDLVTTVPLLVVGIAVVKAAAQWLHGGMTNALGQQVMSDLRRDLHARLLELPPRFFETRHSGELMSRFTADVAQVEFAVSTALGSYVKDSLQVVALLGVCLAIDPWLFVLAFVVLPASVIPVARFARSVRKVAVKTQASMGQLTELTSELLQNVAAVQAYRMQPALLARFDAEQGRYLTAMRRSLFLRGAFTPTVEVLGIVGAALAIGVGARAVASDPALATKLLSFLGAALLMYQPLKALSGTFSQVLQGVGASERLFEIEDAPAEPDVGAEAGPLRQALTLRDVTLSYDGECKALDGFGLEVVAGERVALVGASGAGKTTVFSVLLGFVTPQAGTVAWDGAPLSTLRRSSWRAQVAWVPQEPVLFSGTVRENLLLGQPDATDEQLWEALRQAHAEAFVRAFPRGLDEEVGERGGALSGGQRQRLAIARAFLRRPSLLLLDEPTSALDAASEREVQAGLAELMAGRTVLVVAHRLSTVRDADRIAVMANGRVVELGTHEELVARNGAYAALLRQGEVAEAA